MSNQMPRRQKIVAVTLVLAMAVAMIALLANRASAATYTYGTDSAAVDVQPWDDESGDYMRVTGVNAWKKTSAGARYNRYFVFHFFAGPKDNGPGAEWDHLNCSDGVMRNVKVNVGKTGNYNPAERVKSCESDANGMTVTVDMSGGGDWYVGSDPCTGTKITIDRAGLTDPYFTFPTLCAGR